MAWACSVVRRAEVQEYADDEGEGAATSGSARNAGVLQKLELCLDSGDGDAVDDEAEVRAEADAEAEAEADDASCKRSGGVAGWGEGDCVSDDELSEVGDPARAGEAAQAGSARPAPSLAFAVAREWAGRARALGLALEPVLEPVLEPALEPVLVLELVWAASAAAVEPGPRALSGPWNHLSALCIAAKFTGGMGMCLGDGCTRYTVPGTLVLTHVHAHSLCHTRCLLGTMTSQNQDGSGGRGSNKQQASKQINK